MAGTASQHYYGQTVHGWECKLGGTKGLDYMEVTGPTNMYPRGKTPHIYVALKSHATYFAAGGFNAQSGSKRFDTLAGYEFPNPSASKTGWDETEETDPVEPLTLVKLPPHVATSPTRWGHVILDIKIKHGQLVSVSIKKKRSGPPSPSYRDALNLFMMRVPDKFHDAGVFPKHGEDKCKQPPLTLKKILKWPQ